MDPTISIVQTTVASEADARNLSHALVDRRLAACVQVSRIESTFRWDEKLEVETEFRLDIKTSTARLPDIATLFAEIHPYDTPEFIVIGAEASPAYARWVAAAIDAGN
jgi:periplasmic divalent cation tolerance protein